MRAIALVLLGGSLANYRDEPPPTRIQRAASVASGAGFAAAAPGPLTPGGLLRALSLLRECAGKPPSMLAVELTADHATFQVESTKAPRRLEQYEWRAGELSGPFPVEVRGSGSLEQDLFAFSAVDWKSTPALLTAARASVDVEHGQVSKVLIRRNLPHDEAIGIHVYVDSPSGVATWTRTLAAGHSIERARSSVRTECCRARVGTARLLTYFEPWAALAEKERL